MTSVLNQPYFHDEKAAFAALERIMWPAGQPECCPQCGVVGKANRLADQTSKPSKKNPNGKPVYGLWKCYACRQQFTVRKGTVFEESRLPLHLWFQAAYLMCSSKKGVSANQLHRTLGCTLKTAWFVAHRLREAMAEGSLNPFGQGGTPVEADETYIGRWRRKGEKETGYDHKMKVLTLVDRETGNARSTVMTEVNANTVAKVVSENVAREAQLMTDQANFYKPVGRQMGDHQSVNHAKEEYRRGDAYKVLGEILSFTLNDEERKIVNYVVEHGKINVSEALRIVSTTRWHTARDQLLRLQERGVLKYITTGNDRDPKSHFILRDGNESAKN